MQASSKTPGENQNTSLPSFEPSSEKAWSVIDFLKANTGKYLQAKEIATAIDIEVTDTHVRNVLKELKTSGYAEQKRRGRAHVFRVYESITDIKRPVSKVKFYENNYRHTIHHHIDGEKKTVSVHRLTAVAEYGFDAVVDKEIHHKNKHPIDNRPSNLIPMDIATHKATDALANMVLRTEVKLEEALEIAQEVNKE